MSDVKTPTYTKKDFESDQAVRWCPGCGDYAILAQTQKTMPTFGRKKEDFDFVSSHVFAPVARLKRIRNHSGPVLNRYLAIVP